jgi:hypothetical protein
LCAASCHCCLAIARCAVARPGDAERSTSEPALRRDGEVPVNALGSSLLEPLPALT